MTPKERKERRKAIAAGAVGAPVAGGLILGAYGSPTLRPTWASRAPGTYQFRGRPARHEGGFGWKASENLRRKAQPTPAQYKNQDRLDKLKRMAEGGTNDAERNAFSSKYEKLRSESMISPEKKAKAGWRAAHKVVGGPKRATGLIIGGAALGTAAAGASYAAAMDSAGRRSKVKKDAFGVNRDDVTVAKAFGLRPVKDFVQGAKAALGGWKNPASAGGNAGYAAGQRAMKAPGQVRQAFGAVKTGAAAGARATRTAMPKIPRPTGSQLKVGGAIGGTGLVAGGTGYALGGKKEY